MKTILLITSFLIIYSISTAQDCGFYHPTTIGKTLTYTNYKKPGKPENINIITILSVDNTANGIKINAAGSVQDKKGKETLKYTYSAWCDGGDFYIDMKSMMASLPVNDMSTYKFDTKDLKFPTNLAVGQQLDDAYVNLTIEGPISSSINCNVTDRKVVAIEKVTTAAGTFDCIKISYSMQTKVMFINSSGSAIDWYAKDIGMIRSEVYDKKGKLISTNELTSFK